MVQPRKEALVKEIQEKLDRAKGVVLTDFRGLNVGELNELRQNLRKGKIEHKIFKNTLIRIVAKKCHLEELEKYLQGPTALTFGYEDPLVPLKILVAFAKEHQALEIKAGILDKEVVEAAVIKKIAALPAKEELLAKLMGAFNSPFYGLVNVLDSPTRGLVSTLNAIATQKG